MKTKGDNLSCTKINFKLLEGCKCASQQRFEQRRLLEIRTPVPIQILSNWGHFDICMDFMRQNNWQFGALRVSTFFESMEHFLPQITF